jgi:hypothetical protein
VSPNKIDNLVNMRSVNVFIKRASRSPRAPPRNLCAEINPPMRKKKCHEFNDAGGPATLREFLESGGTNHWNFV